MSRYAIETGGGNLTSSFSMAASISSTVNQRTSSISSVEPHSRLRASAKNPHMAEDGKGQGCDET